MKKNTIIKIICFALAVFIAAYAGVASVGFAGLEREKLDSEELIYFAQDFFANGKYSDYYCSTEFKHKKTSEAINLLNLLNLGDGSKQAYKELKKDPYLDPESLGIYDYNSYKRKYDSTAKAISENSFDYVIVRNDDDKIVATNVSSLNDKSTDEIKEFFFSESKKESSDTLYGDKTRFYYDYDSVSFTKSDYYSDYYSIYLHYIDNDRSVSSYTEKYGEFYNNLSSWLIKIGICAALLLVLLIVLIVFSGKKSDGKGIHLLRTDKIFVMIRTIINSVILYILSLFTKELFIGFFEKKSVSPWLASFIAALICVSGTLVFFDLVLYFARNIKAHKLGERVLIIRSIRKRKEALSRVSSDLIDLSKGFRRFYLSSFIIALVLVIVALIFVFNHAEECIYAIPVIILSLIISWIVFTLRRIRDAQIVLDAIKTIHGGDDVQIDSSKMKTKLRPYADAMNEISESKKAAVEKAVMEQNTKTELITNISHDLKTPLTSIINYIDLLSKTNITNEKALEYIDILGEKSSRLKRLIEDLVEASKATTGNIEVNLMNMSFTELCRQIAGEYEDEMQAQGLELIAEIPDEEIVINADQRMIYRVLDNLMNNARKYSLPGTRVYFSLEKEGFAATFRLKNISKAELNISAEELKQRFVRGDTSRTENGSGLGLSIAESFCELMGAKLELEINGDMFTASVRFKTVPNA